MSLLLLTGYSLLAGILYMLYAKLIKYGYTMVFFKLQWYFHDLWKLLKKNYV